MQTKITVPDILAAKESDRRLTMVTAYDCTFAKLIDRAGVDFLLVGDSLGMVVQGEDSTIPVTIDEMAYHVRLVARARTNALVLGDLPFMSYQVSPQEAVLNAGRLIKAGAQAVKLEGGITQADTIAAIVRAEIPVVGHVGLTPQAVHRMGGHKVQGKSEETRKRVLDDALAVQEAGAFAIVLEGVPLDLAREITEALDIPTIGIGAGPHCDGQVLVMHDLLGLDEGEKKPRFVRKYANLGAQVTRAVEAFAADVQTQQFPCDAESYHTKGCPERARSGMVQLNSIADMGDWSDRQRAAGLRVSFVPTMGYLHAGHLSLVKAARQRGDRVVVSIFVNPIQFDREEDLVSYPRDLDSDLAKLADAGVDAVFVPDPRAMYPEPDEFVSAVDVEQLTDHLCGAHRPGHFRGVATVVSKLFHIVRPHVAVFGEKDYQQLAVIRRMVRDLDFGVEVVGAPIVREADGLAMSSRNARLSMNGRGTAQVVPQCIDAARLAVADGARSGAEVREAIYRVLAADPRATLEYATLCDVDSLEPVEEINAPVQLAVAVWVDGVRLIDNARIDPVVVDPERIVPAGRQGSASADAAAAPMHAASKE